MTDDADENMHRFSEAADRLVAEHRIVIDRPAGSTHPRFPQVIYPLDYGYLEETGTNDGDGVDCWRGSLDEPTVTGAVVTVDTRNADSEVKWLVGCTEDEMTTVLAIHRSSTQAAMLAERHPAGIHGPLTTR